MKQKLFYTSTKEDTEVVVNVVYPDGFDVMTEDVHEVIKALTKLVDRGMYESINIYALNKTVGEEE